jgi:hypothetical protein
LEGGIEKKRRKKLKGVFSGATTVELITVKQ